MPLSVTDASWRLFRSDHRDLKVQPFGGFTNGLGTKRSDVDIVLTGIISPDGHMGGPSRTHTYRTRLTG